MRARARTGARRRARTAGWGRTALVLVITAVVLVPVARTPEQLVAGVLARSTSPAAAGRALADLARSVVSPPLVSWLWHSLAVTGATVAVCMLVAVPAGYVLARARSRAVSAYAAVLFLLQSVPVIFLLVPLYILLAGAGLVDHLSGLTIVYIALALPVPTWIASTAVAEVPVELEHAAWLDGCSPLWAVVRIVVPLAGPGLLSAALYAFLVTWNDYLVADVFIHDQTELTLPLGLTGPGGGPVAAAVMVVPPLLAYAAARGRLWLGPG